MIVKVVGYSLIICLAVCVGLAFFPGDAHAQGEDVAKGADKGIATKKGVGQSLGNKEIEEDKLPGNKEIALTVAATVAMVVVVKWL